MTTNYKLVRSKRRRTLAISIKKTTGEVVVHAPKNMSLVTIEGFIRKNEAWINKHLVKQAFSCAVYSEIRDFSYVMVCGKYVPVAYREGDSTFDFVHVKQKKEIPLEVKKLCSADFMEMVEECCAELQTKPMQVGIKPYKSKWGVCHYVSKKIFFCDKLLMLDRTKWRYVIIHELCHLFYPNHGKQFWTLVSKYVPDWKSIRKSLKEFDFLLNIYD